MVGFEGEFAVYAEDQAGNRIEINADESWETASCIKVAVLIELFRRVARGDFDSSKKLPFNEENNTLGSGILKFLTPGSFDLSLKDLATLMIIISDNVATNILVDFLGKEAINQTCLDLGLKETKLLEKIYFKPDQEAAIGRTTCREYIQQFKLIKEEVFGPEATEEMMEILKNQQLNTMLNRDLPISLLQPSQPGEKPLVEIASKSGSLKNCRNNGGIIFTPSGYYYLAIFTKDFSDPYYYNDQVVNLWAPRINKVLFHHFIAKQGSFL